MIDQTAPQVVRNYLAQLETALSGVATDVRDGIVAGVAEELGGLDAAAAAARIESLGDPAFIAAEARAESPATQPALAPSRWFSILTVLLIMFGGIVFPIIGWAVGIVMMWASTLWSRSQKLVTTIVPPTVALLLFLPNFLRSDGIFGWHLLVLGGLILPGVAAIVTGILLGRSVWSRAVPEPVEGR
ncbi:HAAS signaling domain-containing protein [Lacisediminihabitans changchengi]|uniref:Uncharacterized protein n=1 Tax=Lacisediminihabitans changchengi TaxID=2787634 RepID=A0A934VWY5_9MICO|nr:hypothetical protein [Lacisediminihabitans changchengi]MBK4346307.1 hypothetical protein [Lacisediminihabitans changchengi]